MPIRPVLSLHTHFRHHQEEAHPWLFFGGGALPSLTEGGARFADNHHSATTVADIAQGTPENVAQPGSAPAVQRRTHAANSCSFLDWRYSVPGPLNRHTTAEGSGNAGRRGRSWQLPTLPPFPEQGELPGQPRPTAWP